MTTPAPTPEEHRRTAEELLAKVYEDAYAPMHPYRVDMLSRATAHALLAQGPAPRPEVIYVNLHDVDAEQITHLVAAAGGVTEGAFDGVGNLLKEPSLAPVPSLIPEPAKPAPRKRAAKKTIAPKETSK